MTPRGRMQPGTTPVSPELLACAIQARRLRATMSDFLPGNLLIDPAWDMLIELFIASATHTPLCVKDLILLSGESAASAMRRIDRLQEADLLFRHPDPCDHRRVHVALSDKGHRAMASMLEHLFDHPGARPLDPAAPPVTFRPTGPR